MPKLRINGTDDLTIAGAVWDVKTMSSFAFQEKGDPAFGYANIKEDDAFGYLTQGYVYAEGSGKPFGGWVAVNKETGEISFVPVPAEKHDSDKAEAMARVRHTVSVLMSGENPGPQFGDEPERFRGKETGNRVLGKTCSYCRFKAACWPEVVQAPQAMSSASNPKLVWYTKLVHRKQTGEN